MNSSSVMSPNVLYYVQMIWRIGMWSMLLLPSACMYVPGSIHDRIFLGHGHCLKNMRARCTLWGLCQWDYEQTLLDHREMQDSDPKTDRTRLIPMRSRWDLCMVCVFQKVTTYWYRFSSQFARILMSHSPAAGCVVGGCCSVSGPCTFFGNPPCIMK